MPTTLPLLRGTIGLQEALESDDNILIQLQYPLQRQQFWDYLDASKSEIEAIVRSHLAVKACRASDRITWLSGSYNVCIPVFIPPPSKIRYVFVRIALPYKVGESNFSGNVDEKLRCEVATYLWLQEHCPDIPIPPLFGFGFPNGHSFTAPENVDFFSRLLWGVRRVWSWFFWGTVPCRYVLRQGIAALTTGYIVIGEVSDGSMLSTCWEDLRHDQRRRRNLFRDMARIDLSLNRTPLPRIGSLTMDDGGSVTLTNHPLTLRLQSLENEGIPTHISRRTTYAAIESYTLDLLSCHDSRLRHQPNALHDKDDGELQMAALTTMRGALHHFLSPEHRHGPFYLTLTDMHQSNIFVNEHGKITSLPVEFRCPPYWLTSRCGRRHLTW